jgi:hypothetical protein
VHPWQRVLCREAETDLRDTRGTLRKDAPPPVKFERARGTNLNFASTGKVTNQHPLVKFEGSACDYRGSCPSSRGKNTDPRREGPFLRYCDSKTSGEYRSGLEAMPPVSVTMQGRSRNFVTSRVTLFLLSGSGETLRASAKIHGKDDAPSLFPAARPVQHCLKMKQCSLRLQNGARVHEKGAETILPAWVKWLPTSGYFHELHMGCRRDHFVPSATMVEGVFRQNVGKPLFSCSLCKLWGCPQSFTAPQFAGLDRSLFLRQNVGQSPGKVHCCIVRL